MGPKKKKATSAEEAPPTPVRRSARTPARSKKTTTAADSSPTDSNTSSNSNDSQKRKKQDLSDSDEEVFMAAKKVAKPKTATKKAPEKTKNTKKAVPEMQLKKTATASSRKAKGKLMTPPPVANSPLSSQTTNSSQASQRCNDQMREIFTMSQQTQHCNKCLEKLERLMKDPNDKDTFHELCRNVQFAMTLSEKSPLTKNCLEFISKFFIMRWKKDCDKENRDSPSETSSLDVSQVDELGLECLGRESYERPRPPRLESLVDVVLREAIIPSLNSGLVACRINSCILVKKMFSEIEDMATEVYEKLKDILVNRMADKNASVRAAAAKTLHRFQETESTTDVVISAYQFHLKNDPDTEVRQAVLYAIEPTENTIADIILRMRDVKDSVRKVAYHKLASRVDISSLTIEQRVSILQEGLDDRSPAVRKTVEKDLIGNWIMRCGYDIVKLLAYLDISVLNDIEMKAIEKLLNTIFKGLLEKQIDGHKTKLNTFVEKFRSEYLDERNLLKRKPLIVESGYVWRALASFCKTNETKIQPLVQADEPLDEEQEEIEKMLDNIHIPDNTDLLGEHLSPETSSQESDRTLVGEQMEQEGEATIMEHTPPKQRKIAKEPERDLIDLVLPQIPHMCAYIKSFVVKMVEKECNELELIEYQFLYDQLAQLLLLISVRDDAQKNMLVKNIYELIFLRGIDEKLRQAAIPLMKVLAKNAFTTSSELLAFTRELTQEVYNGILDYNEEPPPPATQKIIEPVNPEREKELQLKFAKISVDIEEIRDEIDEEIKKQNFIRAEELKQRRQHLEKEKEAVVNERFLFNNPTLVDEPEPMLSQQSDAPRGEPDLAEHPEALLKCLQIFTGCLEFGHFTEIDTFIQSHLDKFCFPGLISSDARVRQLAVKGLGLCCLISSALTRQYFALFVQVLNVDIEIVRETALKGMFDFLCEHGIDSIIKHGDTKNNQAGAQALKDIDKEAGISDESEEHDILESSDGVEKTNRTGEDEEEDMSLDNFIDLLTNLLKEQLSSPYPLVRHTAVEGVARLLALGRIYAPPLLTRLLLIWYNPEGTEPRTKQFLGIFFPFFAYTDKSRVAAGQSTFEECFVDTIKVAYQNSQLDEDSDALVEACLDQSDIENMVNFMTQMLGEEAAVRVFVSVLNELISYFQQNEEDDGVVKHLIKALTILPLSAASKDQLKEINVLLDKQGEFSMPPLTVKRLAKLKEKVDALKGDATIVETGEDIDLTAEDEAVPTTIASAADGEEINEVNEVEEKETEDRDTNVDEEQSDDADDDE